MSALVLQGPFLTRAQAARRAGLPRDVVSHRPDLLRIGSEFLEEVYFAFQFDQTGVRADLGTVVTALRRDHGDLEIADWLVRPHPTLRHRSPLQHLDVRRRADEILAAAAAGGPVGSTDFAVPDEPTPEVVAHVEHRVRRAARRGRGPRPTPLPTG